MPVHIDETAETIHLILADRPVNRTEEVRPGIIIEYDGRGSVVDLDVRRSVTSGAATQEVDAAEADPDGLPEPRTPIAAALREARAQLRAQGVPFLSSWEELEREVAERRGFPPEHRQIS